MTDAQKHHLEEEQLARLLASGEPPELRTYLAVMKQNSAYHLGSTVPAVGAVRQLSSGLWIPASAQITRAPIDLMGVYITFSDVFDDVPTTPQLINLLGRYGHDDLLAACGYLLLNLHEPGNGLADLEQGVISALNPPFQQRLRNILLSGRPLFTRQGALCLAKLATVYGSEKTHPEALPIDLAIGFSASSSKRHSGHGIAAKNRAILGSAISRLSMEIIANQWFNRHMDEANYLALFERRWISGGRPSTRRATKNFHSVMGFGIEQLSAVALGLWAGSRGSGHIIFSLD